MSNVKEVTAFDRHDTSTTLLMLYDVTANMSEDEWDTIGPLLDIFCVMPDLCPKEFVVRLANLDLKWKN